MENYGGGLSGFWRSTSSVYAAEFRAFFQFDIAQFNSPGDGYFFGILSIIFFTFTT